MKKSNMSLTTDIKIIGEYYGKLRTQFKKIIELDDTPIIE